jgi:hypothetical protein
LIRPTKKPHLMGITKVGQKGARDGKIGRPRDAHYPHMAKRFLCQRF